MKEVLGEVPFTYPAGTFPAGLFLNRGAPPVMNEAPSATDLALAGMFETLVRGRTRVRECFVPCIQARIMVYMRQHIAARDTILKKPTGRRTSAEKAQLVYREYALKALSHLVTVLHEPFRSRDFYDALEALFPQDGEPGDDTPRPAA